MSDTTQIPEAVAKPRGRPRLERPAVREEVRDTKALQPGEFYGRDGEILSFKGDEYGDSLHVPVSEIPDDWAYQWVRQSVLGNEDKTYSNNLPMQANGWRPVPQDRHPHTMVTQRGMTLMERPKVMNEMAQRREHNKAVDQKVTSDEQHGLKTSTAAFAAPKELSRVSREMVRMPSDIPRPKLQRVIED